MGPTQKVLWKVYVGVVGAAATLGAKQVLTLTWKAATGAPPPAPTDPRTPVLQAVTWGLASGVGVGVSQILVHRLAARHWARRIGNDLPAGGKVKVKI